MNHYTGRSPLTWVPSSYFTMALMYNLLTSACVVMFNNLGVDNAHAAQYASALGLAYTIKPFYSGLLELYKNKKFFVIATQFALGIGLIGVALVMQLPGYLQLMMAMFWMLSFVGAAQDIASDGVYVTSLSGTQQAKYCGVQSLSWNLGKLAVLSGLVSLSGYLHTSVFQFDPTVKGEDWILSWQCIFALLGGIIIVMAIWHQRVMPTGSEAKALGEGRQHAIQTFKDSFVTFFQKRGIWLMIGFALLFRISFGFLNAPSILFMKDSIESGGLNLTNQEFGIIYGTFGIGAMLVGSLVGGICVAKYGLQKSLFALCCCVNIPNVTFLLMAIYQPSEYWLISLGVGLEQFFFGVGSVGFIIYLMQQLAPGKYATTHYAFGSGLMGLCMMLTGMASGHLQSMMGYINYFIFVMIATIPSFLICWFAPFHHKQES